MKLTLVILALLNGGWMLFDGLHVLRTGKYFGPDMPGPLQMLPKALGLDPFRLGPLFDGLGLVWLGCALGLLTVPERAYWP